MKKTFMVLGVLFGFLNSGYAGQFTVGAQFQGWSSNYQTPLNGYEVWTPLSFNFRVDSGLGFYGQTEYGWANYTGSGQSISLNNFSDSIVGVDLRFTSFSLPSMLNIGVNLPTGDATWEGQQQIGNIPTEFIDTRYHGRGLGMNAIYGLSFPAGNGEFGAAVGYLYGGTYNPNGGTANPLDPADTLRLGDSVFLALNHVQPYSGDQKEIIRISAFQSFPTQEGGLNVFQLGTNFNASYAWQDPKGFSFEVGAQSWLADQGLNASGGLSTDSQIYYGPRFYFAPSYYFGDLTVSARAKYILPNGYGSGTSYYNDGGFLLGLEPSYRLALDTDSALRFFASYDFIDALQVLDFASGDHVDATYNRVTFGSNFEVKL